MDPNISAIVLSGILWFFGRAVVTGCIIVVGWLIAAVLADRDHAGAGVAVFVASLLAAGIWAIYAIWQLVLTVIELVVALGWTA